MIEDVTIDTDERGFTLELVGDFMHEIGRYLIDEQGCTLRLRLTQDTAIKLAAQTRMVIQPWVDEGEEERIAYDRASPEEREVVLAFSRAREVVDDHGERMRAAADHMNKARKEQGS